MDSALCLEGAPKPNSNGDKENDVQMRSQAAQEVGGTRTKRVRERRRLSPPSAPTLVALLLASLLVYYLTAVAPTLVPVAEGVEVPFPEATRFLEGVCSWCGANPLLVIGMACGLFLPTLFIRFPPLTRRYCLHLSVVLGVLLAFTYLSVSAPIDRMLKSIEDSIPADRRAETVHRKS